jgi:hypothetical protein
MSARGVPWSRCLVRQTSAESVLLQVEHAVKDSAKIRTRILFIRSSHLQLLESLVIELGVPILA